MSKDVSESCALGRKLEKRAHFQIIIEDRIVAGKPIVRVRVKGGEE
ncbi:hypothetical protein [Cerasicoccus frondis]|nr:hypothetical protein [Cerasicoccus frondis]